MGSMSSFLNARPFGSLSTGKSVEAWTMTGSSGLILEVLTYGGIVTKLLLPDGQGQWVDVVLGFKDLDPYLAGHPYFGAITGRVAGRITNARFPLAGRSYKLTQNEPPNHLHGGANGFDKKVWEAAPLVRADGAPSLQLSYCSPDGEEGYPGTVNVSVTYTVTNDNCFIIDTAATTDRSTPFSLTHHSYFNLEGEGSGSIKNHTLQIDADEHIGTDDCLTLLERTEPTSGAGEDFRIPKLLGDAIPLLKRELGALYRVRKSSTADDVVRIAQLVHPPSGRVLTCSTTNSHLQLYTASALDGSITGKSGARYEKFAGICLECEGFPNGANTPSLGNVILEPDRPQYHRTVYAFSWPSNTPGTS